MPNFCFVRTCRHVATRLCDPPVAITGECVRRPWMNALQLRRSAKPPE